MVPHVFDHGPQFAEYVEEERKVEKQSQSREDKQGYEEKARNQVHNTCPG
jgi:hypothetical protein